MGDRHTIKTALAREWTIAEILTRWPQAASLFTRLRMACVGCPMAAFETPAEAARAYGLAPDVVCVALDGVVEKQALHSQVKGSRSRGGVDRSRTDDR